MLMSLCQCPRVWVLGARWRGVGCPCMVLGIGAKTFSTQRVHSEAKFKKLSIQ